MRERLEQQEREQAAATVAAGHEEDGECASTAISLTPNQQRRAYYDKHLLPKIIAARNERKRSTYVTISNETAWVLCSSNATLSHCEWTVEPPENILPGENEVPCGLFSSASFHGQVEAEMTFTAETDCGAVDILLHCHNGGGTTWWDAACPAPLRVDAVVTGEKNNMVAFRILPGAGTFRKRGGDKKDDNTYTFDPEVLASVDLAKEIETRAQHAKMFA